MKPRAPTFDWRSRCPACATDLGVRQIHAAMELLAEHSKGRRRIVAGEPRCRASGLNVAAEAA